MMMNIRRALVKDVDGIMMLLKEVLLTHHNIRPDLFKEEGSKYTREELVEIISDDSKPVFVAVGEDDTVLGHCFCIMDDHLGPSWTGFKSLYIDDLCVHTECRGQHIGKELYGYVKEYARQQGCYNISLHVWEGNDGARAFYEQLGMEAYMTGMETILG